MHLLKKFVLTLLLLLTIISLSRAAPPSYLLTKKDYLYDTFFKVEATDLMDLDYSQVVVLGRDYTERRISVQLLSWSEGDLVSHWESPNLINEGPVMMTTGRPLPTGEQFIIILTQNHLYLYTYQNERIILRSQIYHTLSPYELSAADLNGDGIDELLVVRLGKRLAKHDEKVVDVYCLEGEELLKVGTSPLLGNIRCLTGGDLDGDGFAELVTESGLSSRPGLFTLLRWDQEQEELTLETKGEKLLSSLVFGMQIATDGERVVLYTADGWGRLNFFALEKNKFSAVRKELSFPNGLVTVTTGDLDGDGINEALVVGHPNNLMVFRLEEERDEAQFTQE